MTLIENRKTESKRVKEGSNESLALRVIQEAVKKGVTAFCICPGARNSAFFTVLMADPSLQKYFWFEERSAAFFALGRCRATSKPVAVITTSGTAAGELLPATMEAFYNGSPLMLITADRPRRFRGTGAPQAAEQVGILGVYAPFSQDIAIEDACQLNGWNLDVPCHLNVCFEEPFPKAENQIEKLVCTKVEALDKVYTDPNLFLKNVKYPLIVVSTLHPKWREAVINFLLEVNAPVYIEAISGIREEERLQPLRVTRSDNLWEKAAQANYPIDGILRIGGIPTVRLWRDLEDKIGKISICSLSDQPFPGLSWGKVTPLNTIFQKKDPFKRFDSNAFRIWKEQDQLYQKNLHSLFLEEPQSEANLVYQLSRHIPAHAHIYLGNSLPIREWDLAANNQNRQFQIMASRGVNGIDGQISQFLGMCSAEASNWAILGDLTTLYDMAGPWIIPQLPDFNINIVVINNSGGQIFSRWIPQKEFINAHDITFEPLARLWNLDYERWNEIPVTSNNSQKRLIEIIPDNEASERFSKKLTQI